LSQGVGGARHAGMWSFLLAGGLPPMLFILITGLLGVGAGFHFALRAQKRTYGFVKLMARATLFGTLAASCADVGATLSAADKVYELGSPSGQHQFTPETAPGASAETTLKVLRTVIGGFAESTSPGILGFSLLALTSLLLAVGKRRLDEKSA